VRRRVPPFRYLGVDAARDRRFHFVSGERRHRDPSPVELGVAPPRLTRRGIPPCFVIANRYSHRYHPPVRRRKTAERTRRRFAHITVTFLNRGMIDTVSLPAPDMMGRSPSRDHEPRADVHLHVVCDLTVAAWLAVLGEIVRGEKKKKNVAREVRCL